MITKADQLKRNGRIKEKPLKNKAYIKWLHEVKRPHCFVCGKTNGIQMHHIKKYSSDARDDRYVIALCIDHHLGSDFSPHGTPKKWREKYNIDDLKEVAYKLFQEYKSVL